MMEAVGTSSSTDQLSSTDELQQQWVKGFSACACGRNAGGGSVEINLVSSDPRKRVLRPIVYVHSSWCRRRKSRVPGYRVAHACASSPKLHGTRERRKERGSTVLYQPLENFLDSHRERKHDTGARTQTACTCIYGLLHPRVVQGQRHKM